MSRRIVFLPYHGFGHINPCLPLAAMLREAGNHVMFAGVAYFRQHLLQQGYAYHTLRTVPFGMSFEHWHNTQLKKENLYKAELHDRRHNTLYHLRHDDLAEMLDELQPDIILLDALQATDFILLYPYLRSRGIALAILYPLLPPDVLPGRPPHNSNAMPGEMLRIRYDTLKVWFSKKRKQWRQKIRFLGFNDSFMIKRGIRHNNIPEHFLTNKLCLHPFRTANLDELILAPLEFDFPGFTPHPKQHYLGFLTPVTRSATATPEFEQAWTGILQKRSHGCKLLYCSFGTTDAAQNATLQPFFEKLIRIAQHHNYLLIISWPDKNGLASLPQVPGVYTFTSVPQLIVLTAADIFITHCGMNSVKESIQAGVPMLLCPIHTDYDPRGNAARAEYHGLGIRGSVANDSEQAIGQKIGILITNPQYKASVLNLRNVNATYTPENLLHTVASILPIR